MSRVPSTSSGAAVYLPIEPLLSRMNPNSDSFDFELPLLLDNLRLVSHAFGGCLVFLDIPSDRIDSTFREVPAAALNHLRGGLAAAVSGLLAELLEDSGCEVLVASDFGQPMNDSPGTELPNEMEIRMHSGFVGFPTLAFGYGLYAPGITAVSCAERIGQPLLISGSATPLNAVASVEDLIALGSHALPSSLLPLLVERRVSFSLVDLIRTPFGDQFNRMSLTQVEK